MLKESFNQQGNWLFKYRGQLPVVIFLLAVPVIYFYEYKEPFKNATCLFAVITVIISILGNIIRAIAIGTTPKGTSGRNCDKQVAESLNTTGIYSTVRHPLYLGNFLIWLGIVGYTFHIWFIVLVILAFWIYYERIMYAEECFLESKFSETFVNWSKQLPAFFPSFKNYQKSQIPFSLKSVFRREYSGWLATAIGFAFIDALRQIFATQTLLWKTPSFIVLTVFVLIAIVLRSLKHYTNILTEEDRS